MSQGNGEFIPGYLILLSAPEFPAKASLVRFIWSLSPGFGDRPRSIINFYLHSQEDVTYVNSK